MKNLKGKQEGKVDPIIRHYCEQLVCTTCGGKMGKCKCSPQPVESNWEKRLANLLDNLYIPSGQKCEKSIKSFIKDLLHQQKEKYEKMIKARLKYCQEQNGLDYCKNCGLSEEDILKEI